MTVHIPAALWSYTRNTAEVDVPGRSLRELLATLDQRYPGLRFRVIDEQDQIRTHIKFFVNADVAASIDQPVASGDEVTIVCALSGG
jgi:molybdopterin converting factor small subunit